MRAGILAAGLGERLRGAGIATPKALVEVGGRPLLEHALAAVRTVGAQSVTVHVNDRDGDAISRWIDSRGLRGSVGVMRRTTASSLETFARLAPELVRGGEPHAIVAMVDGVFSARGLARFSQDARALASGASEVEGILGVTSREDDDRPLRLRIGDRDRIVAIGRGAESSLLSTAGLYLLPRRAILRGPELLAAGGGALRELLAAIVAEGVALAACDLGEVVDVDRPDDLEAAEALGA